MDGLKIRGKIAPFPTKSPTFSLPRPDRNQFDFARIREHVRMKLPTFPHSSILRDISASAQPPLLLPLLISPLPNPAPFFFTVSKSSYLRLTRCLQLEAGRPVDEDNYFYTQSNKNVCWMQREKPLFMLPNSALVLQKTCKLRWKVTA
ncbi:hypothetical protein H6P81_013339 [Aristolochia fimbriata]|uniref:Uncharacterized protein n=1 Tax=Aristolochia fimbriata TaxID=158543 RepID=A0AAV7EHL7_ARIFI|nr:hypothetical protein H6P81_013339 [Aristolochia fimbriata]